MIEGFLSCKTKLQRKLCLVTFMTKNITIIRKSGVKSQRSNVDLQLQCVLQEFYNICLQFYKIKLPQCKFRGKVTTTSYVMQKISPQSVTSVIN